MQKEVEKSFEEQTLNDWNPSGNQQDEAHHKLGKLKVYLSNQKWTFTTKSQRPLWVGSRLTVARVLADRYPLNTSRSGQDFGFLKLNGSFCVRSRRLQHAFYARMKVAYRPTAVIRQA